MPKRLSLGAVLMVLGSCVSLQFGAAFATTLFPVAGAWGTTAIRLVLAAAIVFVIVRPRLRGWTRASWRAAVLYGAALGGMNGFFYASIERLPLGTAVAIEFLGPLVLAVVLSRRRTDLLWIALACLGMLALGLDELTGGTQFDPLGVVFALIAAAFWAAYILASAHLGGTVSGADGLPVGLLIGALVVLPFGFSGALTVVVDPLLLLSALGMAVLASVIPYSLEFAALKQLDRSVFGVLLSLEPAAAAFVGLLVMGQHVTLLGWVTIGCVMVASAGITATTHARGEPVIVPESSGTPTAPIALPDR